MSWDMGVDIDHVADDRDCMVMRDSDAAMAIEPELFETLDNIAMEEDIRPSLPTRLSGTRYSSQSDRLRPSLDARTSDLSIRFSGLSDYSIDMSDLESSALFQAVEGIADGGPEFMPNSQFTHEYPPANTTWQSQNSFPSPNESYYNSSGQHQYSTQSQSNLGSMWNERAVPTSDPETKQNRSRAIQTWLAKREKRAQDALLPQEPVRNARKEAAARRIRVNGRFLKPSAAGNMESGDDFDS